MIKQEFGNYNDSVGDDDIDEVDTKANIVHIMSIYCTHIVDYNANNNHEIMV